MLLEKIDYKRLLVLEDDENFLTKLKAIEDKFTAYMSRPVDSTTMCLIFFNGIRDTPVP